MIAQIRTKNPSAAPLRRSIFVNKRAIVRLGSRTPSRQIYPTQSFVEVNTVESIENSRDKLRMKECFFRYDVKQAEYWEIGEPIDGIPPLPMVGKQIIGFKGHGMQLLQTNDELDQFIRSHSPNVYFLERFYNYAREYRIHATSDHSFLSWRKLRRADAEQRWFFNSTNCNWVGEDHELFQRPNNWDELCNAAVMAVRSVGLDIGAVDIRVQGRNNPDYIVCEVNSAPQLGEVGIEHYRREITNIINNK